MWENDRRHLARLMVKENVIDLQDVPHFARLIVVTDLEGLPWQSWTVQCEIVEQQLLGQQLADEEHVPVLGENGQPRMFEFFAIGQ
jgi:hypothetical protein